MAPAELHPWENRLMLTLHGRNRRFCDGLSRRDFVKIGGLAMGGLSLPQLLQAEANAGVRDSHKSVIMIYLAGGMAHQDTFDLKPNAPKEVRSEFQPIATAIPGTFVGELLPRLAKIADKYSILRSVVGLRDEHSSFQNLTGAPMDVAKREARPHFGSVINRLEGPTDPVMPAFVDLFPIMQHRPYNSGNAGWLGRAYDPVKVDAESLKVMRPQDGSLGPLHDRRKLLEAVDRFRRTADGVAVNVMDAQYQRAFDVLTSTKLVEALDLDREPAALRDRYGRGSSKHLGDGAPMWNDQLLMARRLVEAGARCVTVAYGFWDTHGNNFGWLRERLPLFDQGVSALIEDIHDRGMDRDCTVLAWGEFGRTPKINANAGRDHWSPVNFSLFAGGGLRVGQTIGATDSQAAFAKDRPIHYHDVLATVYHAMGISPHTYVTDVINRPVSILPLTAEPIRELI